MERCKEFCGLARAHVVEIGRRNGVQDPRLCVRYARLSRCRSAVGGGKVAHEARLALITAARLCAPTGFGPLGLLLKELKQVASAFDDGLRQACKGRNAYAVGVVTGSVFDGVKETQGAFDFCHAHRDVDDSRYVAFEADELVVVRGKEGTAPKPPCDVFADRPSDGQTVEGRGASPNLVEQDQ